MFGPSIGGFLYQIGGFSLPFWIAGMANRNFKIIILIDIFKLACPIFKPLFDQSLIIYPYFLA